MPRVATPKRPGRPKKRADEPLNGIPPAEESGDGATMVAESPPAPVPRLPTPSNAALQPPTAPIEPAYEEPKAEETHLDSRDQKRSKRDQIAASINIAKLQAMQMSELNTMAKDLGVENYGTMRKHEVIFH